jgi:hypothetical protein
MPARRRLAPTLIAALLASAAASHARADDRRFVWSDEARVTPPGMIEFEQWVTWEHETKDANNFNRYSFKEELEIGINPQMQIGVELPNWHFQTGPADEKDAPRFDTVGADIRYIALDPVKESFGLAFKPEIEIGTDEFELAGRVILQKNLGAFELVYNATIEAAWKEDEEGNNFGEREGEFTQSFGASYEFAPKWFAGAEAQWIIPMPDWKTGEEDQSFWIGPNISSHHTNWALTVAPLFRVTNSDEEPRFAFRAVLEIDF